MARASRRRWNAIIGDHIRRATRERHAVVAALRPPCDMYDAQST